MRKFLFSLIFIGLTFTSIWFNLSSNYTEESIHNKALYISNKIDSPIEIYDNDDLLAREIKIIFPLPFYNTWHKDIVLFILYYPF